MWWDINQRTHARTHTHTYSHSHVLWQRSLSLNSCFVKVVHLHNPTFPLDALITLLLYGLATWLPAQSHLLLFTHGGFQGRCSGWVSHVYCINLATISRRRLLPQATSQTEIGAATPARFYAWTGSGEARPMLSHNFAYYCSARIEPWGLSCGEHYSPCRILLENVGSTLPPDLL